MRNLERKFIFIHIILWMALLFSYGILANLVRYFFIGFRFDLNKVWFLAEGVTSD
ncbi:MAG: hypothetical protein P1P64_06185 [Treponemataceae bacterium]